MAIVVHVSSEGHNFIIVGSKPLHLGRGERLFVSGAEEWLSVVKIVGFGLGFLFNEPIVVLDELISGISLLEWVIVLRWVKDPDRGSVIDR